MFVGGGFANRDGAAGRFQVKVRTDANCALQTCTVAFRRLGQIAPEIVVDFAPMSIREKLKIGSVRQRQIDIAGSGSDYHLRNRNIRRLQFNIALPTLIFRPSVKPFKSTSVARVLTLSGPIRFSPVTLPGSIFILPAIFCVYLSCMLATRIGFDTARNEMVPP